MILLSPFIFLLFFLAQNILSSSVKQPFPAQTSEADNVANAILGWTPKPTTAPLGLQKQNQLEKRAYIPNPTCGYVSGDQYDSWTCFNGAYCGIRTDYGVLGCCSSYFPIDNGNDYSLTNCIWHTTCYDYSALSNCNDACQSAERILKCSNTIYPYCMEYYVTDGGYSILDCNKYSNVVVDMGLTYNGEIITTSSSTTITSSSSSSISSSSSQNSGGATTVTNTVSVNGPADDNGAQGQYSSATGKQTDAGSAAITSPAAVNGNTDDSTKSDGKSGKSNIGPIVGGVVGGAAVVVAAVGLGYFIIRRKSKSADSSPPPMTEQNSVHQSPPSSSGKAPEPFVTPVQQDTSAPPYKQAPSRVVSQQFASPTSPTISSVSHNHSELPSPPTNQNQQQPSYPFNAQEVHGRSSMPPQDVHELPVAPMSFRAAPSSDWNGPYNEMPG